MQEQAQLMQETEVSDMGVVVPKRKRGRPKKVRELLHFKCESGPVAVGGFVSQVTGEVILMPHPNPSGIRPSRFNVLVKPDPVETVTPGGIIRPPGNQAREQGAAVKGTIIAVSPLAFGYEKWPNEADKPKVGDRVYFAKFAGMDAQGLDGVEYRLMKDEDIAAVIAS